MASAARAPGSPRALPGGPVSSRQALRRTRAHDGSPRAYQDPASIENLDNARFAPELTSTGLRHAFVNASHANQASSILAPRMIRIGVRAEW